MRFGIKNDTLPCRIANYILFFFEQALQPHFFSEETNVFPLKLWTMVTKLVFLVTKAGKPLCSAEIIPLLTDRHPEIIKKQDSLEKYISAFLNTAMKHGRLIPYKLKGVRGNFYCLPEWVNEEGELLPEMRKKIY